ncbi:uncharacterized protein UV8b_03270 [Ustilaginoidea virens]|uniref:Peroxidase n=1 Tax=Ustilaginoidea virens TaxID=1159556 RepID=A0A063BSN6_USTVR|nr:uncharacterized protein UV8b_03270 [Ustilaginoidea virens]QUC19029.1 hypothetical protein UV8b_03270 [Ustilaginoidea virens]GAO18830.1 hypothetical protein UVI_02029890 [Ustilaginoidea virens]
MKFQTALVAVAGLARAYHHNMNDIEALLSKGKYNNEPSTALLGDLKRLKDNQLTFAGKYIKALLQNSDHVPGRSEPSYPLPLPARDTKACKKHTCCIWRHIYFDMAKEMKDAKGDCNDLARAAVRLGFHDAGTWSSKTGDGGGADGSIVLAGECESRAENKGLEDSCKKLREWFKKYKKYHVGMADLIQFAHNVASAVCLSGPGSPTFVGRKDRHHPSPKGNLPSPDQSADELLALFAAKTISPRGLVSLLGAHSVGKQRFVDTKQANASFDTTPEIWDTNFYDEVLKDQPSNGVFRLKSDGVLARDARSQTAWKSFMGFMGTFPWGTEYNREYARLSLLGVKNINHLTVCNSTILDPDPAK